MLCSAFVVLCLLVGINGQAEFRKPCPTIPPMTAFNLTEFSGAWFELARYDTPLVAGGECVQMNFKVNDRSVTIENYMRRKGSNGQLKAAERFNLAGEFRDKFVGTFNLSHPALAGMSAEHHVITTDYKNYALIWRCDQVNSTLSRENAWLLARSRELKGTLNQTIEGYIKAILSPEDLHRTLQAEDVCGPGFDDVVSSASTVFATLFLVAVASVFATKNAI